MTNRPRLAIALGAALAVAAVVAGAGYMVGLERGERACDPVRDALRVGMSAAEKAIETFGEQEDKDRAETKRQEEQFWGNRWYER